MRASVRKASNRGSHLAAVSPLACPGADQPFRFSVTDLAFNPTIFLIPTFQATYAFPAPSNTRIWETDAAYFTLNWRRYGVPTLPRRKAFEAFGPQLFENLITEQEGTLRASVRKAPNHGSHGAAVSPLACPGADVSQARTYPRPPHPKL